MGGKRIVGWGNKCQCRAGNLLVSRKKYHKNSFKITGSIKGFSNKAIFWASQRLSDTLLATIIWIWHGTGQKVTGNSRKKVLFPLWFLGNAKKNQPPMTSWHQRFRTIKIARISGEWNGAYAGKRRSRLNKSRLDKSMYNWHKFEGRHTRT